MKRTLLIFIILTLCLLSGVTGFYFASETETADAYLQNAPAPDPAVFQAALRALEQYRDQHPLKSELMINPDSSKGLIETNWFPNHKGEVILKVQIAVRGATYRVDVWQRLTLAQQVTKTEWSRRTEMSIQFDIEKVLKKRPVE